MIISLSPPVLMEEMPMEIEDGPSGSGGMRRSRNVSEMKGRYCLEVNLVAGKDHS